MEALTRRLRLGAIDASNPRVWIVVGITLAGVVVLAEAGRRRRRWLLDVAPPPPDFGAFVDRFELEPSPQPPPPAARLPLASLTFAVSDNFEIQGYVAGFGNPDWKQTHGLSDRTAVVVTALLKQGATCVGRTVMDEFGFGITGYNLHYRAPSNPAFPSLAAGGSCSGSAVAVSSKLVDIALGVDTMGDVRIPASSCGILGFRPSHGVVSAVGILPNSQSLDTIGWFAQDPLVLQSVGNVLLPASQIGLKQSRQLMFADDCFELSQIPKQKSMQVIKCAVENLFGYETPKHINIGKLIASSVPSLKDFYKHSAKAQQGTSVLKALSTVMLSLQRYEFKTNHGEWINTVKPKITLENSPRVLDAVNSSYDDVKPFYNVRTELRVTLNNLLKDSGVLVIPTLADYPLKKNFKLRVSAEFEDRLYTLLSIAGISGCCQISVPVGSHNGYPVSISFIAAHGRDKFLLDTVLDMYSSIQEEVAKAVNSLPVAESNGDVDAAELLKEKGNAAFKGKQWNKAISFYTEAIKLSGTNATYYCNRAAAYLELGGFQQAEADCNQAISLDKKNVKAYLRRGTAREMLLYYKEALQDFRYALALEPQNKAALTAEKRLQKYLK